MNRTHIGFFLVFLLLAPFSAYRILAQELTTTGAWVVTHIDGDPIYSIQCGLDVTLFTLKYFSQDYSLRQVSESLPLTKDGISLYHISNTLEAHGLESVARKELKFRDVVSHVRSDLIAIFPMKSKDGHTHYFIALKSKDGKCLLINVPKGLTNPVPDSYEEQFVSAGAIAIFVKPASVSNKKLNEIISVSPKNIDLGEFYIDQDTSDNLITKIITLENTSSKSVLVSNIQSSCSCSITDWHGGIIFPNEKKKIYIDISKNSWGEGASNRRVVFFFRDKSCCQINITGTGLVVSPVINVAISQKQKILDVTNYPRSGKQKVKIANVYLTGRLFSDLNVYSTLDGVLPEIVSIDGINGELWVQLDMKSIWDAVEHSSDIPASDIIISCNENKDRVSARVSFRQNEFFELSKNYIALCAGEEGYVSINNKTEEKVRIESVHSDPDYLSSCIEIEHDTILHISKTEEITPGIYHIKCKVVSDLNKTGLASFIVNIKP